MNRRTPTEPKRVVLGFEILGTIFNWVLVVLVAAALRRHVLSSPLPSWFALQVLGALFAVLLLAGKHIAARPDLHIPVSRACSCVLLLVALLTHP